MPAEPRARSRRGPKLAWRKSKKWTYRPDTSFSSVSRWGSRRQNYWACADLTPMLQTRIITKLIQSNRQTRHQHESLQNHSQNKRKHIGPTCSRPPSLPSLVIKSQWRHKRSTTATKQKHKQWNSWKTQRSGNKTANPWTVCLSADNAASYQPTDSSPGTLRNSQSTKPSICLWITESYVFELCKLLPKNVSNFHKHNEPVEVSLNGTTLKTTQPKTKKTITTIEKWSTAFSSYRAIIIEKFPERAQELIQYFMTIRYAANNTTGLAWVVYDNQFRTQAANNRNLNWGHIDMQLWVKILCVAPSRLREEYSIFEHGPQPKETQGAGTCFQFNRAGVICKRQDCPYQHKCNKCFGNHPGFNCPNKGGGGIQQTPKATQSKLPQPNKL